MLFDSHTHLNNEGYTPQERQALIEEIARSDVSRMLWMWGLILQVRKWRQNMPRQMNGVMRQSECTPHDAKSMDDMVLTLICGLAKKDKVQAIGEIGLDFHYDFSDREDQRYWFRRQIQLCQ